MNNPLTNAKVIGSGITSAVYQRQDSPRGHPGYIMGRGDLVEFNRCPHRWQAGYERDGSSSTEWGTLMDGLVLDTKFNEHFAVTPETYPDAKTGEQKPWNWNATYCKTWRDEHTGVIVKYEHKKRADEALLVLTANPDVRQLLKVSTYQVMVIGEYVDKATEIVVPVKCLVDIVPAVDSPLGKSLWDFKTAASAGTRAWKNAVHEHGYHVQGAMYLDLYMAATGEERIDFRHLIQESYPPWETGMTILSSEFIELGRYEYTSALKRYCECLKQNKWPSYESMTMIEGCRLIEPEAWMIKPA